MVELIACRHGDCEEATFAVDHSQRAEGVVLVTAGLCGRGVPKMASFVLVVFLVGCFATDALAVV